jgi:uncharacterized protein (UPF0303 family)
MEYSLESLLAEEASLRLPSFSNETAWRLGNLLVRRSRSEGLAVSVAIVRGGQRLFWFAAEGTSPDNDAWLERKMRTVLRFGHSSLYMGRKLDALGLSIQGKYDLDPADYSVSGGAFPLVVRGTGLVGAVAVSGLAQEDDHAMVVEALAALRRK